MIYCLLYSSSNLSFLAELTKKTPEPKRKQSWTVQAEQVYFLGNPLLFFIAQGRKRHRAGTVFAILYLLGTLFTI